MVLSPRAGERILSLSATPRQTLTPHPLPLCPTSLLLSFSCPSSSSYLLSLFPYVISVIIFAVTSACYFMLLCLISLLSSFLLVFSCLFSPILASLPFLPSLPSYKLGRFLFFSVSFPRAASTRKVSSLFMLSLEV